MIDVLLLLALPAAGKSEICRYLERLDPAERADDLRLGRLVQLDDYRYVHFMRLVSRELAARDCDPVFFSSPGESMLEPYDWGTLIHLLNQDHAALGAPADGGSDRPAACLFDRIDRARAAVGLPAALAELDASTKRQLEEVLTGEARRILEWRRGNGSRVTGRTVVIEFARGGPEGAAMPLPAPYDYRYALSQLRPEILERAVVLYLWVTPAESRRRSRERARAAEEGSVLFHAVPDEVMRRDYGCDDMAWLFAEGGGTSVEIEVGGVRRRLPAARLDNRIDQTSFLRADPTQWPAGAVARLHRALRAVLARLDSA